MKTIIYNIGTLAGILPADVRKLEGEAMNNVECIENAYLVIEEGKISDFGSSPEYNTIGNNPSHSFVVGPAPCGQGGSTVLKSTVHPGHQVAAPEADFCLWVFCIYSLHQIGTVKVSGCFSCYDVVFHISLY